VSFKRIARNNQDGNYLSILSDEKVERIHSAALEVLWNTGMVILERESLELLDGAGCRIDANEQRAFFPPELIEKALRTSPRVVKVYDRLGEEAMVLGSGCFHARTSSGATGILDLESGKRRTPTVQDAVEAARLADALPHVDGVSSMAVQPAELEVSTVDVHVMRIALENSTKPIGYVCLNQELIPNVLEMTAAVVGGEQALSEKPIITALAESTSPLRLVSSQLEVLKAFASRSLPLTLHAHPMAGFTAPVTLAGELVITHAEILSLITLAQLTRPGTPLIYGMSSSVPDMRTGMNLSGAPEIGLLGAAVARLAKYCGLPCLVSTGTDVHAAGAQSVLERLMTLLPPAMAGVDLVNLTTLGTKMSFCMEQLVLDDMLVSMVERFLGGIKVDEESLALDLIDQVGPGGAYLTTDHTRKHHRKELLTPDLITRTSRVSGDEEDMPDLVEKARQKARQMLVEHSVPPLPEQVKEKLDAIVAEVEGRAAQA
jgi:trimethylamine---corrinoid protein Co-methyltransferase